MKDKGKQSKVKHPKSRGANLSHMKLLVSDPEFQDIVADVRGVLKIPDGGFSDDTEVEPFYARLYTLSDEVMDDEAYRSRGRAIRATYEAGGIVREEYCARINRHEEEVPLNYKTMRIRFIVEKFHLPDNFHDSIGSYIVRGIVLAPYHNFTIGSQKAVRGDHIFKGFRGVSVTFYTAPTNEDFREAKKMVDVLVQCRELPSYRPMKNIDRDLNMERWYANKVRFDSVENKTYETKTSEIAEELLGDPTKPATVRGVVRDLNKTREKLFHSRGKK